MVPVMVCVFQNIAIAPTMRKSDRVVASFLNKLGHRLDDCPRAVGFVSQQAFFGSEQCLALVVLQTNLCHVLRLVSTEIGFGSAFQNHMLSHFPLIR